MAIVICSQLSQKMRVYKNMCNKCKYSSTVTKNSNHAVELNRFSCLDIRSREAWNHWRHNLSTSLGFLIKSRCFDSTASAKEITMISAVTNDLPMTVRIIRVSETPPRHFTLVVNVGAKTWARMYFTVSLGEFPPIPVNCWTFIITFSVSFHTYYFLIFRVIKQKSLQSL